MDITFKVEGAVEFEEMLSQMQEDFGPKDSQKILNKAVKESMKPILSLAQQLVPKDTGALAASLRIEARKPTGKDKRSKYVEPTDIVISTVTTAPGHVLAKTKFHNLHNKSSKIKQVGIASDARAVANEFGTAKMAAHPFMRPAMEGAGGSAVGILTEQLRVALEKYKSKKR